jgi:hypothetical protein
MVFPDCVPAMATVTLTGLTFFASAAGLSPEQDAKEMPATKINITAGVFNCILIKFIFY